MQLGGWGHLGVFGDIWGQNPKIFKQGQIIYQNEALDPEVTKVLFEVIRGRPTQNWGVFLVIWGQNQKLVKTGQFIYQIGAIAHGITKKIISRGHLRSLNLKSMVS